MLSFVNLVLVVWWYLQMSGFEIYSWYSYFGEFDINMNKFDPIVWGGNRLNMDDGLKAPWHDAPPRKL